MIDIIESKDKDVLKYVFTWEDAVAESVLYKYPTYKERTVICCSTQSGCPVGCRFCGSGDYFVRNLTSEEIVSQPIKLLEDTLVPTEEIEKLQIMFMSMGEPLLNLKNLIPALRELNNRYPKATLLISSIAPDINYTDVLNISKEIDKIGLQFSIHESTDEARNKLIPFKNKLSLEAIGVMGVRWFLATGRKPFINYCVNEHNNTQLDVERLKGLFNPEVFNATLSVICERDESIAMANERQRELAVNFSKRMLEAGYDVRVFNPAGQDDIGGGCGQLWFVQSWMQNNPDKVHKSCGYGKEKVHTPKEIQ